jgi:hypothetical protein
MTGISGIVVYVVIVACICGGAYALWAIVRRGAEYDKEFDEECGGGAADKSTTSEKEKTPWVALIVGSIVLVVGFRAFDLYFIRVLNWAQDFLNTHSLF